MENRGEVGDRRQGPRYGRRAKDVPPNENISTETAREVSRLRMIVQVLADAVQTLTALLKKP